MSSQIKSWFLMLSPREKTLVSIAIVAMTIALLWLIILNPILSQHKKLSQLTADKQIELRIMQRQSALVKQLQQQASGSTVKKATGNPQQLIEQALQTWRLKPTLQRMQSQGSNKVAVSLKNANSYDVMRFIAELETKYGLSSTAMAMTKSKAVGMVNVRLTLEKI